MFHNSQWGTICGHGFQRNDAKVLCRMLGLQDEYEHLFSSSFKDSYPPIQIVDLHSHTFGKNYHCLENKCYLIASDVLNVQCCDKISDIEFSVHGAFLNNGHDQQIGKPKK